METAREMADKAIASGAIDMALGTVHLPPPKSFKESLDRLWPEARFHKYASPSGYLPYREALRDIFRQRREDLSVENILATNGVTGGLTTALRAICKPGDKVALLEPFYPAHDWAIRELGLESSYIKYGEGFEIDIDNIASVLPGAQAFVLANPANPTGAVFARAEIDEIIELCRANDVALIVDEVYRDFIWEGEHYSPLLNAPLENVVILRSFSKNLALAGWRVGYAVASEDLIDRMKQVHEALYVGAPAPAQFVLAEILSDPKAGLTEFKDHLVELYGKNRELVQHAFREYGMMPVLKEGAYYMMIKHGRESDVAATQELLDKGIAVAPGAPFYRPGTRDSGFIRAHFAMSREKAQSVGNILTRG